MPGAQRTGCAGGAPYAQLSNRGAEEPWGHGMQAPKLLFGSDFGLFSLFTVVCINGMGI
jgi:hypothetical protein